MPGNMVPIPRNGQWFQALTAAREKQATLMENFFIEDRNLELARLMADEFPDKTQAGILELLGNLTDVHFREVLSNYFAEYTGLSSLKQEVKKVSRLMTPDRTFGEANLLLHELNLQQELMPRLQEIHDFFVTTNKLQGIADLFSIIVEYFIEMPKEFLVLHQIAFELGKIDQTHSPQLKFLNKNNAVKQDYKSAVIQYVDNLPLQEQITAYQIASNSKVDNFYRLQSPQTPGFFQTKANLKIAEYSRAQAELHKVLHDIDQSVIWQFDKKSQRFIALFASEEHSNGLADKLLQQLPAKLFVISTSNITTSNGINQYKVYAEIVAPHLRFNKSAPCSTFIKPNDDKCSFSH